SPSSPVITDRALRGIFMSIAGRKSQVGPSLHRHHIGLPCRLKGDPDVDEFDARYAPGTGCDAFLQVAGGRTTRRGRRHGDADDAPLFNRDVVDESEIDDIVAEFGVDYVAERIPDPRDELRVHSCARSRRASADAGT